MVEADFILGLLLVLGGRKFFWLSVAIIGFLVGMDWATVLLPTTAPMTDMIAAALFGVLGAFGAVAFEWVAIILVGFLGGGYFLVNVLSWLGIKADPFSWLFLIGGAFGMFVMIIGFDFAVIVISSFIGAMLIMQHLPVMKELSPNLLFILIFISGMIAQYPRAETSYSTGGGRTHLNT